MKEAKNISNDAWRKKRKKNKVRKEDSKKKEEEGKNVTRDERESESKRDDEKELHLLSLLNSDANCGTTCGKNDAPIHSLLLAAAVPLLVLLTLFVIKKHKVSLIITLVLGEWVSEWVRKEREEKVVVRKGENIYKKKAKDGARKQEGERERERTEGMKEWGKEWRN